MPSRAGRQANRCRYRRVSGLKAFPITNDASHLSNRSLWISLHLANVFPLFIRGPKTGVGAYVAVDKKRSEIVLAVRGSNNIRNFLADVYFVGEECDYVKDCYLHKGFAAGWREIRNVTTAAMKAAREQNPNFRLVVTGHSLGGAVATIATARLRTEGFPVEAYTFGSPRVGNAAFVNWFAEQDGIQRRVTHEDDPVPRLPPLTLPRLPDIPVPDFSLNALQLPPLPPITIPSLPSKDLRCPPPKTPSLGLPGLFPAFNIPLPIPKLPNLLPSIGPVADNDKRSYQYRHVSPEYWLTGAPLVANSIQNDYPLCYVQKCVGIANTTCNGGTVGFDIFAHLHYLGETSGCTGNILDL